MAARYEPLPLGKWLPKARTYLGMNLGELAERSGVKKKRLYALEHGEQANEDERECIVTALGISQESRPFDGGGLAKALRNASFEFDGEVASTRVYLSEGGVCYCGGALVSERGETVVGSASTDYVDSPDNMSGSDAVKWAIEKLAREVC